jgi:polysaccharide deacetylase family protein (PEP-CTERM system associated)
MRRSPDAAFANAYQLPIPSAGQQQPALLRGASHIVNAMTVDVEDYFHVEAFKSHIDRHDWDHYPCRVERNIETILQMFSDQGVRATFFTLGWVAQRYPQLVRRIVEGGHELASHGFDHTPVSKQGRESFRADVRRTKYILEDLGGVPVKGYRAPTFSIGAHSLWALDVLGEEGHSYSSSIYPIRHDLYGMREAPRFAFRLRSGRGIVELPITTVTFFNQRFPCGGGGFFRLLPYRMSRWAMRRVGRLEGQPCIFYFHPWEIDPYQPRLRRVGLRSRSRHYTNLHRMETRLRSLLVDFKWDRMDQVFQHYLLQDQSRISTRT